MEINKLTLFQQVSEAGGVADSHTYAADDPYSHYTWKRGSETLHGKKFIIPPELLSSLGLPFTGPFTQLNADTAMDFVFVTLASDTHFVESIDAVARAQMYFPHHIIYYYDLGLTAEQVQEVM